MNPSELNRTEKLLVIIVISQAIIIGLSAPILASAILPNHSSNADVTTSVNKNITYPTSDIPSQYTNSTKTTTISTSFSRDNKNQIFQIKSHDALLVHENGTYYMIAGFNGSQKLFSSNTPANESSWVLIDGHYLTRTYELDTIVEVNGTYLIYSDNTIYKSTSITTDNWTKQKIPYSFDDSGAYYNDVTGKIHIYYEKGSKAGYSGQAIGHAVSPNGINNWTVYPEVWNASDTNYGVGDFDVRRINNSIVIIGDYDTHHPKYNIAVWFNTNPYTTFTRAEKHALIPRNSTQEYADNYGVGDPTLIPIENQYLIIANGHQNKTSPSKLHSYTGNITVTNHN